MGKRSRDRHRSAEPAPTSLAEAPVGPRQPCPCGSGRRYKNCHGDRSSTPYVARPFAGLTGEPDLVAMREFVPTATARVELTAHPDRAVRLCSLLPAAAPGLVRPDGEIWLGLQVQHGYRDPSRDLAAVLENALEAEPGSDLVLTSDPGEGTRLQDLLAERPLEVTVHAGFDYWLEGVEDPDGTMASVLEQANGAVSPTVRLVSVPAAYWADMGERSFLRWAMPQEETPLLDAISRLHVAGEDRLVEDSRLIGMFRAYGLLVPVWELPSGVTADDLEDPAAAYQAALATTLADDTPLTGAERSARAGLANRQVTLR